MRRWRLARIALAGVAGVAASAAAGSQRPLAAQAKPVVYGYRIVNTFPHDPKAYTQGLIFRDGFLYESTGLLGQSSLRKVKLETGEVLQQERVGDKYFAEGLAEWNGRLIQLTWQTNVAFVYDLATLRLQSTFRYPGEGWGLTRDQTRLILSDGTDSLRFLNPTTFQEQGRLAVKDGTAPVKDLNELEFVRGEIFANVWHTDRIARISPQTGRVAGWIDLKGLMPATYKLDPESVLNGIAYDAAGDRLFVTGKLWPKLYEIKIERRP